MFFLIDLFCSSSYAQIANKEIKFYNPDKRFSVSIYCDYVSSAQLQPKPNSTDPIERDATINLNGTYGFGGEISYQPPLYHLDLIFYLSTEYMKLSQNNFGLTLNDSTDIGVDEQFTVIPIEFGLKWHLPFGSDNWKIYIGGGGGIYFGKETRSISNLQSSQISSKPDFSLNILTGFDYFFERNLSANFELKFREAAFDSKSSFPAGTIIVSGNQYQLENPFYTKFIADGVRISLGLKYYF